MNLFGVVLLAIISTTNGLIRPHIDASPSSPKEGDNITLQCIGNYTQGVSYVWLHNGDVVHNETKNNWYLPNANRKKSGSYSCQVKSASNETKTSEITNITILYTLHAPGDLKVVPLNSTSLHVSWSAPSSPDTHQKPIHYNVYYRKKLSPFVLVNVTKEEYTISNLLPATKYEVQVSAVNINGEGENSTAVENTTTDAKSSKVLNLTAISGLSQRIELSWQRPISTNGDISGFKICRNETSVDGIKSVQACETIGHVWSHSLTNLGKYSTYDIWIYPINSAGNGEPAVVRDVTTREELPTDIRNLTVAPSYYNLSITWIPPLHMNGKLRGYNVSYVGDGGQFIKACTNILQSHCFIHDLAPSRFYTIEVTVSNSLFSTSVNTSRQTLNVSVSAEYHAQLPSATDIRSDSFTIKLVTFEGPIRFYDVIVEELGTTGNLPARKPNNYTSNDVKLGTDGLYVAGRLFDPSKWGNEFIVGHEINHSSYQRNISTLAFPNNKRLKKNTYYGLFLRGYAWDNVYQSTMWYPSVRTKGGSVSTLSGGAIAGTVVGTIVFICIVMAILYVVTTRRRDTVEEKKQDENEVNKFSIPFKKDNRSILGGANDPRVPVKVEDFQERVFQLQANSNYKFSQQYSMISRELDRPYNNSRHMENNQKNRYHNVPAYDETRVVLELIDNDPHSDYINANFIDGFVNKHEYIATQGPLPETVFDLWRMVWENDVSTIVSLTKLEERGRLKCAQYWPDDHAIHIKDFVITPTEVNEYPDHVTRTFHVTRTGQAVEKILRQFHFIAWPDFGVPEDPSALLCFIRKVNNWRSTTTPCIVHCSAGVGRTGTYITIDSQLNNIKQNHQIDIYNNVQDLRAQRCLMVQTEDQYMFIHTALLDYMESEDTEVEASELSEYINRKCEVDDSSGMSGLFEEFILLANNDKKDRFKEADKSMNQPKNRYKNILPYDSTRVILFPHPGLDGSDYINASYIDSYLYKDHFIATQAPMESTASDFWRMAWEQNCVIIVMLIKETDLGVGNFFSYWPHERVSMKMGYFIIEAGAETTYGDYIHREVKVTNTEESSSRIVSHFQYTTWPENGLPENGLGLVELIGQVRRKLSDTTDKKTIIVHCSGGVGRTGVFIALSNLIERAKAENVVDVYQTVKKMRLQRTAMVQTKDQYEFCYRVVQEYLMSFDLYANYSSRESSE